MTEPWSVERRGDHVLVRFEGQVTEQRARDAADAVVALLGSSARSTTLVCDVRGTPRWASSVRHTWMRTIAPCRERIASLIVVSRIPMHRAIAGVTSLFFALPIECVDELPRELAS